MQTSREIMNKAGLLPKLRLGQRKMGASGKESVHPTGPHRVKIIEDKMVKKLNTEGVEEYFVRYIFEEGGQKMQYDCHMKAKVGNDPHYLVQALAEVEPGEELILEMKKAGVKSYIEVTRVALGQKETVEADDDGSTGEVAFEDEPDIR